VIGSLHITELLAIAPIRLIGVEFRRPRSEPHTQIFDNRKKAQRLDGIPKPEHLYRNRDIASFNAG